MVFEQIYPSSQRDNLLEIPDGKYKFGSLEIVAKPTAIMTSRQTYAVLEWLGDVGGLNDSLYIIAQIFLAPFTSFFNSSFMAKNIFRYTKKTSDSESFERKMDK